MTTDQTALRTIVIRPEFKIGYRLVAEEGKPDPIKQDVFYDFATFLDEYVWVDERWSKGTAPDNAEAWRMAAERLIDALTPPEVENKDGDLEPGKWSEDEQFQIEPSDWLKLCAVVESIDLQKRCPSAVFARKLRKSHMNAILLAKTTNVPKLALVNGAKELPAKDTPALPPAVS